MPLENQELSHCQEKHDFLKLDSIAWVSFEEKKKKEKEEKKGERAKCLKYVRQSDTELRGSYIGSKAKPKIKSRNGKLKITNRKV